MAARAIAAQKYVDSIRNPAKRRYAHAFALYLRNSGPIWPARGGLSYLAGQAVELRLRAIWRGEA